VPSGVTKASFVMEGASAQPVTRVNPRRRLDRVIHRKGGEAEPSMSRRRRQTAEPSGRDTPLGKSSRRTPPGYRGRDVGIAASGTGETLPGSLRGQEGVYQAEPKSHPAGRESDEVIVPVTARTNNLAEGRTSTLIGCGETGGLGYCPTQRLSDYVQTGMSPRVRDEMQGRVVRLESSFPEIIGKPCAGNPHARSEREGLS
jgi:hypothetical protein